MRKRSLLALVCLLLSASPTFAAIARHASPADSGNINALTITFSYTVGSGSNRLITGSCFLEVGDAAPSPATYAGNALTIIGPVSGGGDRPLIFFYQLTPTSGANNVSLTFAGAGTRRCQVSDYDGVGGFDVSATNTANFLNSITVTPTVGSANAWVIAGHREGCGAATTWTGETELLAGGGLHHADSNAGVSAGSYTVTAATTGCSTALIAASFTASGGAATPGCKNGLLMQGAGCEVEP